MYRLLVPVGQDEELAVEQATFITSLPVDLSDIEVTVMHVLEEVETELGSTIELEDEEEPPEAVGAAVGHLEDHGVAVDVILRKGTPDEAIFATADDIDADHIVVGERERTPTGKAIFGSVSQSVILSSDLPVTVLTA